MNYSLDIKLKKVMESFKFDPFDQAVAHLNQLQVPWHLLISYTVLLDKMDLFSLYLQDFHGRQSIENFLVLKIIMGDVDTLQKIFPLFDTDYLDCFAKSALNDFQEQGSSTPNSHPPSSVLGWDALGVLLSPSVQQQFLDYFGKSLLPFTLKSRLNQVLEKPQDSLKINRL